MFSEIQIDCSCISFSGPGSTCLIQMCLFRGPVIGSCLPSKCFISRGACLDSSTSLRKKAWFTNLHIVLSMFRIFKK